jgi:hypothetical protein
VRKILIGAFVAALVFVFSCTLVLAGPGCPLSKTAATCPATGKTCAIEKSDGVRKAEEPAHPQECSHLSMAVEKMTDPEAEGKVRNNLEAGEGVICLMSLDPEDGKVVLCYDSKKTDADKLVKLVADAGFDASVVPTDKDDIKCTGDVSKCKKTCGLKSDKL